MQNGCSVEIYTHCIHAFARLYAQSVLISKISASELSRKFIKSALLVGCYYANADFFEGKTLAAKERKINKV